MSTPHVLGAAAGLVIVSSTLLPSGPEAPRWALWARLPLVGVLIAAAIVDYYGDRDFMQSAPYRASLLAVMVAGVLLTALAVVRNWRDDAALDEEFGPNDGYIERPHVLTARARGVLLLIILAALLALTVALILYTPYLPE